MPIINVGDIFGIYKKNKIICLNCLTTAEFISAEYSNIITLDIMEDMLLIEHYAFCDKCHKSIL